MKALLSRLRKVSVLAGRGTTVSEMDRRDFVSSDRKLTEQFALQNNLFVVQGDNLAVDCVAIDKLQRIPTQLCSANDQPQQRQPDL